MKKLLIIAMTFITLGLQAQKTAKVIRIVDGDTFVAVLLKSKDTVKIRVRHIDCPEGRNGVVSKQQVYFQEAKNEAVRLLLGKTVKLYYANIQSYGREIARVKVDGYYFDRYMLYNGYAWAYPQIGLWIRMENKCRKDKKGLFNLSLYNLTEELMHPFDFRVKYSTRK
jgi:endonuclease YncB( thermonuclease family)